MNPIAFTPDQLSKSRIIHPSGNVDVYDDPAVALKVYYETPSSFRIAFRAKGDKRPVYPWDFVGY